MNRAIELHDSSLVAVSDEDGTVRVRISLYLHVSAGNPGKDAGTGWGQAGEFVIENGVVEMEAPGGSLWVLDGAVEAKGIVWDNLVPLPFRVQGAVRLRLRGSGWCLVVAGSAAEVVLQGTPTFVEDVPEL